MHDIDFLPAEYRQSHAQKRLQLWRIAVLLGFLALLSAASLVDRQRRQRVLGDMAAIEPLHAQATAQIARLGQLQARLAEARAEADLYTYLRHPWPRTQLLASLLGPLPEEITFEKVVMHREAAERRGPATLPRDGKTEEQQEARLSPPARDLKRLRAECDSAQTVILLSGLTSDSGALHRYLDEAGRNELFRKAQLRSSESLQTETGSIQRFSATFVVAPGYGQPGGLEKMGGQGGRRKAEGGRGKVEGEGAAMATANAQGIGMGLRQGPSLAVGH